MKIMRTAVVTDCRSTSFGPVVTLTVGDANTFPVQVLLNQQEGTELLAIDGWRDRPATLTIEFRDG